MGIRNYLKAGKFDRELNKEVWGLGLKPHKNHSVMAVAHGIR